MFAVRISLMLLILAGPDALRSIGIENPPGIYMWTQDNKVQFDLRVLVRIIIINLLCWSVQFTALLLVFLIGGQIENQLLSTGAFEVYVNGEQNSENDTIITCTWKKITILLFITIADWPHCQHCIRIGWQRLARLFMWQSLKNYHVLCGCSDIQVWSKLDSGRLPSLPEMKELVEPQLDPPAAASSQINLDAMSA